VTARWQGKMASSSMPCGAGPMGTSTRPNVPRRPVFVDLVTLCPASTAGVHDTGDCVYEAELHRLKGTLLLRQLVLDESQAEAFFHQALAIARRQQARSLELRAAMSLARLWQRQGQRTAAYELLAPVYAWFTEGFDTSDLQEAKALLKTLGEGKTP
jgi:hypothetical protein